MINSLTMSSYNQDHNAPKKSIDWCGKASTSYVTWSVDRLSGLKIPKQIPILSDLVGDQ